MTVAAVSPVNELALFFTGGGIAPARADAVITAVRAAWEPGDGAWEPRFADDGSLLYLSITSPAAPGVGAPGQALIERLLRAVGDANGSRPMVSAHIGRRS